MRRRGFSLTELSFVITIMMILSGVIAGGGSYMMTQSRVQGALDNARTLYEALNHFMQRGHGSNNHWMYAPATNSGSTVMFYLRPYLKNSDPAAYTQFVNPYTDALEYPLAVQNTGINTYPTNAVNFSPASYPTVSKTYAGQLLYFCRNTAVGSMSNVLVWNGETTKTYDWFAVQVVDDKGYPVVTMGR